MSLQTWFEKGLTADAYRETLDYHKDNFAKIYDSFELPKDEEFFQDIQKKQLRVIVLAEPWCGHCMLNIPILLHFAKATQMDVRFLLRDENLELMDQYLTNGNRTIPIFIFINQNGEEVAKWGPMAEKTRNILAPHREKLPPKGTEGYDEAFKEMVKFTTSEFRENRSIWEGVYTSLKETIEKI